MDIVIRQATLKDREAIWDFMRAAYEEDSPGVVQYKVPRRWNWQFADNPFVKDKEEGDLLPIWLACHGQEIAGQMCAMPMRITIGGRTYDGGWGCDFIVLKKYRGLGIGWRLNQAYCEHFQVVVHVTQALATAKMWERCGSVAVEPVSILWKIVRLDGAFVFRYLNSKTKARPRWNRTFKALCRLLAAHRIASAGLNAAGAAGNALRALFRGERTADITEVVDLDEAFSAFVESASAGYDALVKREPRFLRWKYIANPVIPYHIFVLREDGETKGYVVLRRPHPAELSIGVIADIFTARDDDASMEALVSHAVAFFGKSVSVIQVLVSADSALRALRRAGFRTIKTYEPHFVCLDADLRERLRTHTRDWLITFADHDQDQIRPVE